MREVWRPVPIYGYGKPYKVSSLGRVMYAPTQKILKIGEGGASPYYAVSLRRFPGDKPLRREVHRLVAMAFLGKHPAKAGLVVNHIDHNRYNNTVDNLEWVTQAQNLAHCRAAGRVFIHRDAKGNFIKTPK